MHEYEDGVKMTKISDTDNNSCSSNTDSMEFQQTGNQSPALQHVSNWIGAGSHHEDQNQQSRKVVISNISIFQFPPQILQPCRSRLGPLRCKSYGLRVEPLGKGRTSGLRNQDKTS